MAAEGEKVVPEEATTLRASRVDSGANVGRYRVEKLLGQGGMGAVYAAEDTLLGRRVALKMLAMPRDVEGSRADEAKARLLREARAAAALAHPNVVAIYDVGEHEGAPFLAMELVAGQTLRARLASPSTVVEKSRWLSEIASALAAAHARGIVHRDIKPDNVMVGIDGSIKVLDFGIARRPSSSVDPHGPTVDGNAPGLATITAEGAVIGTPLYMAPEQIRGEKIDARADQFAWGVVAYEMFAGKPPWDASSAVSLVAGILHRKPESLSHLAPEVPTNTAAVIERALEKSPDARFDSMQSLKEAFEASTSGRPPTKRRRSIPRWTLAAVTAMVAAGALAVGAAKTLSSSRTEGSPIPSASAPTSSQVLGVAITDLPLPRSSNAEALAAYTAGIQALRDSSSLSALNYFERARKLDPSMGAAYLRGYFAGDPNRAVQARDLVRQAIDRRSTLPEHEALLLDAIAPCAQNDGGDDPYCIHRFEELTRRFPRDAEYAYWIGAELQDAGQMSASRDALSHALALDPKFLLANSLHAFAIWYLGDLDGAARELASCASLTGGTDCLYLDASLEAQRGNTSQLQQIAERILGRAPDDIYGQEIMFLAAGALDAPAATLKARLTSLVDSAPTDARAYTKMEGERDLAWYRGDFLGVARAIDDGRASIDARRDITAHQVEAAHRAYLAEETGDFEAGARAARAYLDERETLIAGLNHDEAAIDSQGFGVELRALRLAGKLSREAMRAERDKWVARWGPRFGPDYQPFLWLEAYATTVIDSDDAKEAVDALPRFHGLPKKFDSVDREDAIGRMYLLLDRVDDALPFLEESAHRCLPYSPRTVWGTLLLGEAREKKGDTAAACAAYARVLERWGHAKPKSVTADEAKRRIKALHCP